MPKKKKQATTKNLLEFDSSRFVDEEAPSPLPSPIIDSSSPAAAAAAGGGGGGRKTFFDFDYNDENDNQDDDDDLILVGSGSGSGSGVGSSSDHNNNNDTNFIHHRPTLSSIDFSSMELSSRMRDMISLSKSKKKNENNTQKQKQESCNNNNNNNNNNDDVNYQEDEHEDEDDALLVDSVADVSIATSGNNKASGAHHRMVSSSDFSAMQLLRMRDLLAPNSTNNEATIDENTPLVIQPLTQQQQQQQQQQQGHSRPPLPPPRPTTTTVASSRWMKRRNYPTQSAEYDDNNDDDDDDDDLTDDDEFGKEADDTKTFVTKYSVFSHAGTVSSIFASAKTIISDFEDAANVAWADYEDKRHYDWRDDWKGSGNKGGILKFMRWLATGIGSSKQSDDEIQENLNCLARLLSLLREYHDRFGMPKKGGPKDQEYVLREVTRDLYLGGAPIWVLQPVMQKVAEGLTGNKGVEFMLFPRRAFVFVPSSGATSMFEIIRGYDMQRLDAMESIAVKLASFASNTNSTSSIPARWPKPQELRRAFRAESVVGTEIESCKEDMTEEILTLASESEGLFHFVNTHRPRAATTHRDKSSSTETSSELGEFWTVEDTTRELFRRLVAIDAIEAIDKSDIDRKALYSPFIIKLFRIGSSAGACAFWFGGSWFDIAISGILAVMVAWIGSSPWLNKQERIIFEAVASLIVGLVAGIISIQWPNETCFGAMAISGILDLFQGFRVVYSIIEVMSKHSVTGASDFLEGVFFTALIAYFLKIGLYVSVEIMGKPHEDHYLQCMHPIDESWYFLFVPVAAISWSGLFNPHYIDLPFMAAHGILGYVVSYQLQKANVNSNLHNFIAAMCVSLSAGIISRFTGRQALGNTVAGLYVLIPGAYLVTTVYNDRLEGFLTNIIICAVIIGIGAWTGTLLCSPTLIGINRGLFDHQNDGMPSLVEGSNLNRSSSEFSSNSAGTYGEGSNSSFRRRRRRGGDRTSGMGGSMLFF